MPPRNPQLIVDDALADLQLRLGANFELALKKVKFGSHPDRVSFIVNDVYDKMMSNNDKAIGVLEDVLEKRLSQSMIDIIEIPMKVAVDMLEKQLMEVALYGQAQFPFRAKVGFNPYRPVIRCAPARQTYYGPKKKAVPAPNPVIAPGEGPGPDIILAKLKKKVPADWEGWNSSTWALSENWEDLATHAAYKEIIKIKEQPRRMTNADWEEKNPELKVVGKGKAKAKA